MASKLLQGGVACSLALWLCCGAVTVSCADVRHIVQKGETVWGIARKYGVDAREIIEANKLAESFLIFPGQMLFIPQGGLFAADPPPQASGSNLRHIVQKGETVWSIAGKYKVKAEEIIRANRLTNPSLIFPGQGLIIPGAYSSGAEQRDVAALCRLPRNVRPRGWGYIVIHHSDTTTGNAAIFDQYHRMRGMENGLAYHFVIGNGRGAGDGEIQVGGRWLKQAPGGHTRNQEMNEVGIGICLVGNFQRDSPTRRQMESLFRLVEHLMKRYKIPRNRVIGHREVRGSPTNCPGRNFSLVRLRKSL